MPSQLSDFNDGKLIQDELRQNEKRFRDFAEAASDWFFEMDQDLRFTYVSDRHQEILGVSPDAVIGKRRWDAHAHRRLPEEEHLWREHIATMEAHRDWKDFTYTLIRDDGRRIVISNSGKAIFNSDGSFLGYRGVGRDVTVMARVEAQLQSVLDIVPDAIITINADGLIASFSPAAERLFGYTVGEVLGQNVKMLMPQPYRDAHDGYLANYQGTGKQTIIGKGREVEAQHKDGTVFPINLAVNEMQVEGRTLFTGLVHDISEIRKAHSFNARLGHILDRSINEIYVFDAKSLRFVQTNRGARTNLGYRSRELRSLTPVDIKPEITQEQFAEMIAPLRDGSKDNLVFVTKHQRKNGSVYPVEVHLQLMDDETPPVFVAIILDMTETEKREAILRQSQKMDAIGQLTGGIAHDFNNLLTVILGNNDLLARRLADDAQNRQLLAGATSAAERAAQLTGQLLTFARRQPLETQVLDPNALIEEMQEMLQRVLGETIELSISLAPDIGRMLADRGQVHSAILNLAINARDAMQDGGRLIIETSNVELDEDAVKTRAEAEPGHYVRMSVRDSGTGMPHEIKERVLEPFFTTKEPGKGTGLGLSMVHGFAKQSGGHIDIYSELGHGTAVSLYLPNAGTVSAAGQHEETVEAQPVTGDHVVMVVEDDPAVRDITVARLEHLGYQVAEAETGPQALGLLNEGIRADVILTDMVMPGGMSGADLVREIGREYPNIKAIFTSGYAPDGLTDAKDVPWLRKPYTIQDLARTLNNLLHIG